MRGRGPWLLLTVVLGCATELDAGVVAATTGSTEPTVGGSMSSEAAASDPSAGVASTEPTSSSATTTTGDASSDATGSTTGGETGTTGEVGGTGAVAGSACDSEQKVCTLVELDGEPAGFCGETLELKGITQEIMPGVWAIEDCGACELCGGPTYTLEFLGPDGWTPTQLPLCTRVSIDYAPMDNTPWACAFLGVGVWADDGLGEDPAPLYVAASIVTDPPSDVQGLQVGKENVDPKLCDETGCCYVEPGVYDLIFSGAGIGEPLRLEEKAEVEGATVFGRPYDMRVERSRSAEQCWKIPHFDWAMIR